MKNKYFTFDKLVIEFLLLIVTIISLLPFFKIGFTTADDLEYYLTFLNGNYWEDAQIYAKYSGRFYFLITKPLYSLVYAANCFALLKFIQNALLLSSYIAFAHMIRKIFNAENLGIATYALLVCFTPVTSSLHIPFIAYPGFFTLSFALLCLAVIFFLKYIETDKYAYVIVSAVLCFIVALFYETYLIFLLLFCLFLLIRNWRKYSIKNLFKTKDFYKEMLPFVCVVALYVGIYFIFRAFVDNQYDGSSFAHPLNWENFRGIIHRCTLYVSPLQQYKLEHEAIQLNSPALVGHLLNYRFAFLHASPLAYIHALIVCFVLTCLLAQSKKNLSWKVLIVTAVSALVFAWSSHFLIAVSAKYNIEWGAWIVGYVTSYYAYFGVIVLMLVMGLAVYKLGSFWSPLRYVVMTLLMFSMAFMVVITDYTNDCLAHEWQRSEERFFLYDDMVQKQAFNGITEQDVFYCPSLYESGLWGNSISGDDRNAWSLYMNLRYGLKIQECNSLASLADILLNHPQTRVFVLDKKESVKYNDMLLTMAQVDPESIDWEDETAPFRHALCDSATLYYYAPVKRFTLMMNTLEDSTRAILSNKDTVPIKDHWNRIPVSYNYWNHSKSPVSVVQVKCPKMRIEDFYVTDLDYATQKEYLDIR
ncbi:MAG: hypothetical protein MJZ57_06200 [Bacteroidales bacterium]|nr:hypothetical protein [Bacteroidales bacterium]